MRDLTIQIAAVNKALLSVKRAVDAGNRMVFEQSGSYIQSLKTGEKIWLKEKDGQVMLDMWVKKEKEPESSAQSEGPGPNRGMDYPTFGRQGW